MAQAHGFHGKSGTRHFLGLREDRRGGTEIIYDDGAAQRIVWRVADPETAADDARLREALEQAVKEPRVLSALYTELRRRAISIEIVAG